MATSTRAGARAKSVHRSAVEQAEAFLQQLPKKEKEHLSLQEAIGNIADSIREAIAKGHSYAELAGMLSEQFEVSVSAWSLKRYLSLGSKQGDATKATPSNGRRRRKPKSEPETVASNGQVPVAAQVAAAPILTVVPDAEPVTPRESEPSEPVKVRKARTPRAPKAGNGDQKRTKSSNRKAKADAGTTLKTPRRGKPKSEES